MPQVKEPIIRTLVKKALQEAELAVGSDNTKFGIKIHVSNPQSETKQGIRIQLSPKESFLEPDKKEELSAAIMTKFNNALEKFNLQISSDTDTSDPEAMGFFIPLDHIKNMIKVAIGATSNNDNNDGDIENPLGNDALTTSKPSIPKQPPKGPTSTDDEELNEQDNPLDRAAKLAKEPLPGYMSDMTGLGLKRSGYENEQGGDLTLEELYEKLGTAYELLVDVFKDIYKSDYKFKTYYENNEDEITRTMGAIAMMKDDVEDRLKVQEPVDDKSIEELKKIIKKLVKEQAKPSSKSVKHVASHINILKTSQPKKYQAIVDKYIAQGGRPEDVEQYKMPWLFFIDKMIFPVGMPIMPPDGAVEEKKSLNEMRVRDLKEISGVVIKEDFYNFINAGNNVLRTLEEKAPHLNGKKYLEYLVKHNIM